MKKNTNFITKIIKDDLENKTHEGWVVTRFPPEPNGYLHIGHAKSILLNYNIYKENLPKANFNLRFDDTNPTTEDIKYVNSIIEDVKWLGVCLNENIYFSSDYFDRLFNFAIRLIKEGLAYVDDLSPEEIKEFRGSYGVAGKDSPYRGRSVTENLSLFENMKKGMYREGEKTLRAKIDMSHSIMCMRDPILYRIKYEKHYRTEDKWCIYPTYDYTHGISDVIEKITHSICTLEFTDNRHLYNWFVNLFNNNKTNSPKQIEASRLNLDYTVLSKRRLSELVNIGAVSGWDDPRLPTLSGLRRRGYPVDAIKSFMEHISVSKVDSVIEYSILENFVRKSLNVSSKRLFGVLDPIKVNITNWEGDDLEIECPLHPSDEAFGVKKIFFGSSLFIDRSDFLLNPPSPKKWYRLGPGRVVRLKYGYIIKCNDIITDENGEVVELNCTYYKDSLGGKNPLELNKKVKGIIHWVNANHCKEVVVNLYDRLFTIENPSLEDSYLDYINPNSCKTIVAKIENNIRDLSKGECFELERVGYFCFDSVLSCEENLVLNMAVSLKDSYQKK